MGEFADDGEELIEQRLILLTALLCVCVCAWVCVCVCVHACVCLGDYKVARVGRPTTYYKLVIRPWESGMRCIDHASHATFPRSDNYYMYMYMCIHVCMPRKDRV